MAIKFFWGTVVAVIVPVVAARLLFSATAYSNAEPVVEPYSQDRMEFVTWNGERWTAWIREEAFVLTPRNQSDWHRHANSTLAFFDWDGNPMQAKIEGNSFALAHEGNWQGDVEHEHAIRFRDWDGNNKIRTVAQLRR